VRQFRNPVTTNPDRRGELKQKQRRCKHVVIADLERLSTAIQERGDNELLAAVWTAYLTGCRPAEMPTIEDLGGGRFYIHGAKKRDDRGLDRVIRLDADSAGVLSNLLPHLRGADMDKVRKRLYTITRSIWPARKPGSRPTLYSFRHMLGSELKASGMDRVAIAYLMGHQATSSVDVYGDRRRGKGGRRLEDLPSPGVSEAEYASKIRVNHETPGPQKKSSKSLSWGPRL
jgi:integrase